MKRCFGQFFHPTLLKIQFIFLVIINLISNNPGNNNIQKLGTHTLGLNLLVYCSIRRSIFKRLFTPIPHPFMSTDLNIIYFSFSLYTVFDLNFQNFWFLFTLKIERNRWYRKIWRKIMKVKRLAS